MVKEITALSVVTSLFAWVIIFIIASSRFQHLSLNIDNVMPVTFVILWAHNHTDYLEDIIVSERGRHFQRFSSSA